MILGKRNLQPVIYLAINLLTAAIGFFKSYYFMKVLSFEELGILTVVQTFAMIISNLHFGFSNGGFRLLIIKNKSERADINNNFVSLVFLLSLFIYIISIFIIYLFDIENNDMFILSITLGLSLLLNGWFRNYFLALTEYRLINIVSLTTAILSLLPIFILPSISTRDAVFIVILQPLIFVVLSQIILKELRPTKLFISKRVLKEVMHSGFAPFLAGLTFVLFMQIERWSITYFLSAESLGHMSLVFLMSYAWMIVPDSIMNLYFPKVTSAVINCDHKSLKNNVLSHFGLNVLYVLFGSLSIYFLLGYVLDLFLPKFLDYVYLANIALLGLSLRVLVIPFSIVLMAAVKSKLIIYNQLLSLGAYVLLIALGFFYNSSSLFLFVLVFDVYFLIQFVFVVCSYVNFYNKMKRINIIEMQSDDNNL